MYGLGVFFFAQFSFLMLFLVVGIGLFLVMLIVNRTNFRPIIVQDIRPELAGVIRLPGMYRHFSEIRDSVKPNADRKSVSPAPAGSERRDSDKPAPPSSDEPSPRAPKPQPKHHHHDHRRRAQITQSIEDEDVGQRPINEYLPDHPEPFFDRSLGLLDSEDCSIFRGKPVDRVLIYRHIDAPMLSISEFCSTRGLPPARLLAAVGTALGAQIIILSFLIWALRDASLWYLIPAQICGSGLVLLSNMEVGFSLLYTTCHFAGAFMYVFGGSFAHLLIRNAHDSVSCGFAWASLAAFIAYALVRAVYLVTRLKWLKPSRPKPAYKHWDRWTTLSFLCLSSELLAMSFVACSFAAQFMHLGQSEMAFHFFIK